MNEKMTNILLVEDEESHADLVCRSFNSASGIVSVTVTRNLNEARSSIAKSTPDIIIADFVLPDGKGIELIPANKEESPYPVIILTSHGDEKIAVEAMKAGAFDYIVKSEAVLDNMPHICERIMREWNHTIERKKAEEALSKSEEKYRKLVETAQDAIVCDINGIIIDWNKSAERVFGYSKDEIIGKPVNVLLPDRYKNEHHVGFDRFIKTGEAGIIGKTVELVGLTKEGVEISIEMSLTYQRLEQEQYLITAIIRDITERKQADKELRQYEHIVSCSTDMLALLDKRFIYIAANQAYLTAFNKSREDLIGKAVSEVFGEEFFGTVIKPNAERSLTGEETHYQAWFEFPAYGNRYMDITYYPYIDMDNKINGFVVTGRDITERKKMEKTLLQSQKLKSLGTITAGVAHEFNNILAIISGNAQLMEGSRKDDKELTEALRAIKRATNDGAQISRRMLKFTKTAKDTAGFVPLDINELINQTIEFTMPRWKNMAQAKGINYHMDTEGMERVPSILCNLTELREVFVNIINNALDAMPDGGCITVATRCVRSEELGVDLPVRQAGELRTQNSELKGDFIEITFADTGEGMSDEVKKNIFDPFFTTKGAVGTGLGMSTAYGIVTRHGGKIEVESKVGRGSTFTLQFPSADKADSTEESSEPKQEIKTNSLRILVVDDEEKICNILDKFFSKRGHLVRIVDNGREAIILTKVVDYDLVLCDMAMPEVYGYDVIRALNKLEKRPKIGIITGWNEKLKPLEEKDLKVDFIIKKPFDFSELTKYINELGIEGCRD